MDFYHSWIYVNIINTEWFVWGIVVFVVAANFLGPIILWFVISGRPLPFISKKKDQQADNNKGAQEEQQKRSS